MDKFPAKYRKCRKFFDQLSVLLGETHEVMGSCNKDLSAYLVPIGTGDQVTYHSKPIDSFRISDHWSWYSNLKKCADPTYIQCWNVNVPSPRKRDPENPRIATMGRKACQVAYFGTDHKYHCIYGDYYDPDKDKWFWIERDPSEFKDISIKGVE